jgi:DNA-binding transcriptional LysR family regulator
MQKSSLAGFNLNLLLIFEALLIEQNVSRAARRVGLTQPSLSNALSRLRLLFRDDLFYRTPQGMRPTSRALELAAPIEKALNEIRMALDAPEPFDPASTTRQFSIGASDNVDYAISTGLSAICEAAPYARFIIVDAAGAEVAFSMLDFGAIDVAVGMFRSLPKRFDSCLLYSERYICIAQRGHPELVDGLTLEKFVALPHLSVARDTAGIVDAALAERGLARRMTLQVPNFALVPHLLEGTGLLSTVGERIGRSLARRTNLECYGVPLDIESWDISAVWLRRINQDEPILWLLSMLKQSAKRLNDPA